MSNLIERGYYEGILGVRKEFPKLNAFAVPLFMFKTRLYLKKNKSIFDGHSIPKEGSAIIVSNHFQEGDSYKIWEIGQRSGRLIRAVIRASLIDPTKKESPEYLAKLGDKQDSLNKHSRMRAFVLKGIGTIPVIRDRRPTQDFLQTCYNVLNTGQLLGMYIQGTRNEDCLLRNLQTGAASFAKKYPDVPVLPMATSGSPDGLDQLVALPHFTYAQKVKELGREIPTGELTIIIADSITEGLPSRVQRDWQTRRPEELTRLTTPRQRPAA